MKFKTKYNTIVYYKDGSYNKKYDNGDWYNTNNIQYFRGCFVHRDNGPAIEYVAGAKEWYKNGKRHREDGPATEYDDRDKQWWLNGINYSEKEYWKTINLFKNKKKVLDDI